MNKIYRILAVVLILALLMAACSTTPTSVPQEPVVTEAPTQPPAVTQPPAKTEPPAPTAAPTDVPTQAPEKVTITWFEHLSSEWGNEWFDKVTADFEAETGIHVERISAPWNDLWPKMTTWSQSGEMPDVYGTWAGWTATISEWEVMADLDPLITKLPNPDKFVAQQGAMWPEIGKFGGELVMVPWWLQPYGLFYNKEAFEEKGYSVPATWDELRTLLEQMKADGVDGMEMTWGVPAEAGIHFTFLQWMWRTLGDGGQFTDENGNPAFNTPEGKAALEYWYNLYNDELLMPGSEAATVQQNRGDFCSGKTLMIIDGPWMGATCAAMGSTFTIEMAPGLCGEKTCGNVVYPWYLVVASTSKHPVEALMFIDYLTSDEVALEFSKTYSIALANPIRYDDEDFKSDPITGKIGGLLAAPGNAPLPPILYGEEVQAMVATEWQKVLFGEQSIDQALENILKQWTEITSK